ncbi:MAG: amidohydrolase [Pseudomonadota bacterium]
MVSPLPGVDADIAEFRHTLHACAEPSGDERRTAGLVRTFLQQHPPDSVVEGLSGHGLAAVYKGRAKGPSVLLRAELDALPIAEQLDLPHASTSPGLAHKCGHDGHMAVLAAVARVLSRRRPDRGRAILLFQPAEETGAGAAQVLADPRWAALAPDWAFALHNLPGFALGQVIVRRGAFASASRGFIVELEGSSSHAAEPERGRSPALAMAQLIQSLSALPQDLTALHEGAKATVIHARLGDVAFGTTPGRATVMATLRSHDDTLMTRLVARCEQLARGTAATYGLGVRTSWTEVFPATHNHDAAQALVLGAARELQLDVFEPAQPFAWSEDFGHITAAHRGCLFGLGAGVDHPALHSPGYDFPDALISTGAAMLERVVRQILNGDSHPTRERS